MANMTNTTEISTSKLTPMLLHQMEALATSNPIGFGNLCDTINATYYMNYSTKMERALLARDTSEYCCYDLSDQNEVEFNHAYNLYANAKTYLWVSRGEDLYAAIYCVDYSGCIRFRKHFWDKDDIEAMMLDYKDTLRLCMPLWHVEQYLAFFKYQLAAGGC